MTNDKLLQRWKDKLAANLEAAKYQMQFAGLRLGVMARLDVGQHGFRDFSGSAPCVLAILCIILWRA